jgi:hypothetical protein
LELLSVIEDRYRKQEDALRNEWSASGGSRLSSVVENEVRPKYRKKKSA